MKLNPDCIRDILICIESKEFGSIWYFDDITKKLPSYEKSVLQYHCAQLQNAGLIVAIIDTNIVGNCQVHTIDDLSWEGHEFISNVRQDSNWNKTKEIATKAGSFSFNILKAISEGVATAYVKQQLNLL